MTRTRISLLRARAVLRLSLLGLVSAASASAQTSPAAAPAEEDVKALARRHFQRGVELANQGAYAEALAEFSRAYQLSPHYSVLYNVGQAEIALGHSARAIEALKRYLVEGGAQIALDRRQQVEAELILQFQRTATLEIRVDLPGAWVSVDDEPKGRSPLAGPIRVDVGPHRVTVVLDSGARHEQSLTVAGEEHRRLEFQLGAPSSTRPPASPPSLAPPSLALPSSYPPAASETAAPARRGHATLGYVIGAVGIGLGGAALAHFLWNQGRYRQWQSEYNRNFEEPTAENRAAANRLGESVPRASAVTLGLAIGAGLALGTGTILIVTDGGAAEPRRLGSWRPMVGWRGEWQ